MELVGLLKEFLFFFDVVVICVFVADSRQERRVEQVALITMKVEWLQACVVLPHEPFQLGRAIRQAGTLI